MTQAPLVLRGGVGRLRITLSLRVRANAPADEQPEGPIARIARSVRSWFQRGQLGAGRAMERSRYTGARI